MRQEQTKKRFSLVIALLMPLLIGVFVLFLADSLSKPEKADLQQEESLMELKIQDIFQNDNKQEDIFLENDEVSVNENKKEEMDSTDEVDKNTFITEVFPPKDISLSSNEFPMQVWVRTKDPLHVLSDLQVYKASKDLAVSTPILSEDRRRLTLPIEPMIEIGTYTVTYKLCSIYNICEQGSYNFYLQ